MNKKKYEKMYFEVISFASNDVILTSSFDIDVESGGGLDW